MTDCTCNGVLETNRGPHSFRDKQAGAVKQIEELTRDVRERERERGVYRSRLHNILHGRTALCIQSKVEFYFLHQRPCLWRERDSCERGIERDREGEIAKERERERETGRETEGQRERERERGG